MFNYDFVSSNKCNIGSDTSFNTCEIMPHRSHAQVMEEEEDYSASNI